MISSDIRKYINILTESEDFDVEEYQLNEGIWDTVKNVAGNVADELGGQIGLAGSQGRNLNRKFAAYLNNRWKSYAAGAKVQSTVNNIYKFLMNDGGFDPHEAEEAMEKGGGITLPQEIKHPQVGEPEDIEDDESNNQQQQTGTPGIPPKQYNPGDSIKLNDQVWTIDSFSNHEGKFKIIPPDATQGQFSMMSNRELDNFIKRNNAVHQPGKQNQRPSNKIVNDAILALMNSSDGFTEDQARTRIESVIERLGPDSAISSGDHDTDVHNLVKAWYDFRDLQNQRKQKKQGTATPQQSQQSPSPSPAPQQQTNQPAQATQGQPKNSNVANQRQPIKGAQMKRNQGNPRMQPKKPKITNSCVFDHDELLFEVSKIIENNSLSKKYIIEMNNGSYDEIEMNILPKLGILGEYLGNDMWYIHNSNLFEQPQGNQPQGNQPQGEEADKVINNDVVQKIFDMASTIAIRNGKIKVQNKDEDKYKMGQGHGDPGHRSANYGIVSKHTILKSAQEFGFGNFTMPGPVNSKEEFDEILNDNKNRRLYAVLGILAARQRNINAAKISATSKEFGAQSYIQYANKKSGNIGDSNDIKALLSNPKDEKAFAVFGMMARKQIQ